MDKDEDWHFGQTMATPLEQKQQTVKNDTYQGMINSNWLWPTSSTGFCSKMKHTARKFIVYQQSGLDSMKLDFVGNQTMEL
jgi:hypothetical protein